MNSLLTTLPPPPPTPVQTAILTRNGFNCSLLTLAPGEEIPAAATPTNDEQILFVVDGEASVHFADNVTTMLGKESALLIPGGKDHRLAANSGRPVKVLRIAIPPRVVVTPQLITLAR